MTGLKFLRYSVYAAAFWRLRMMNRTARTSAAPTARQMTQLRRKPAFYRLARANPQNPRRTARGVREAAPYNRLVDGLLI